MILLRLHSRCTFCQRVNMKILGQQNQWKGRHQGLHVDSSLADALNGLHLIPSAKLTLTL